MTRIELLLTFSDGTTSFAAGEADCFGARMRILGGVDSAACSGGGRTGAELAPPCHYQLSSKENKLYSLARTGPTEQAESIPQGHKP